MNESGKSFGSRKALEKSRGHSVSGSITRGCGATKGFVRGLFIYIYLEENVTRAVGTSCLSRLNC